MTSNAQTCKQLPKGGAEVNALDDNGKTPLHRAAETGDVELCASLLKQGADVNAQKGALGARTPLHWATIISGSVETCALLLEHGANVNAKDDDGSTPLFWACDCNRVEICRLLLKNGADVDAKNKHNYAPLTIVAGKGHLDEVVELLLEHRANVDTETWQGNTPLHLAAESGHPDTCRLLLKYGAKVTKRNQDGKTSIKVAKDEYEHCRTCTVDDMPIGDGHPILERYLKTINLLQGPCTGAASSTSLNRPQSSKAKPGCAGAIILAMGVLAAPPLAWLIIMR